MHLCHERLDTFTALGPAIVNVLPDRALSDISRMLLAQPLPDPLRGMTLLARRVPVRVKPGVDQLPIRPQLRCGATGRPSLRWRHRHDQRLTHRPPVNTMTLRQRPDRQALSVPVPSDLLERLHS